MTDTVHAPEESTKPLIPMGLSESAEDEKELKLTPHIEALLSQYIAALSKQADGATPIHVDEIASHVAKFYELIRKVIDWKEDNVLRRAAMERIFKRLMFSRLSGVTLSPHRNIDEIAETLTLDLIRGGHLPNDEIPTEKILIVKEALSKYVYFIDHSPYDSMDPLYVKKRINYQTFVIDLAACELEDIFIEPVLETGLIRAMTEIMLERIKIVPKGSIPQDVVFTQTYIAVCRTLFDMDDSYFAYHLLQLQYPEWKQNSTEFIRKMSDQLPNIWNELPTILNHPLGRKFYSYSDRDDTVFTLIGDVMNSYKQKPKELQRIFRKKTDLLRNIDAEYEKRFGTLKKRLFRLGVFSTISVFASNWITFFIVEVPLAALFTERFSPFTILIDFTVPTAVMFALVAIIRPPRPENKKRVLDKTASIVYEGYAPSYIELKTNTPKRPIMRMLARTLSFLIAVGMLSLIAWIFWVAGLPISSVIFDTFTIALTVFAAVTIRNKSKELTVGEPASIAEFFLDMLSVPVARLGSFLARKWKEYNIVAFIFTFLIETPFVKVVDVIEHWSQFLKERRSELR